MHCTDFITGQLIFENCVAAVTVSLESATIHTTTELLADHTNTHMLMVQAVICHVYCG